MGPEFKPRLPQKEIHWFLDLMIRSDHHGLDVIDFKCYCIYKEKKKKKKKMYLLSREIIQF